MANEVEFRSAYSLDDSVIRLRQATCSSALKLRGPECIVGKVIPARVVLYRERRHVRNSFKPVFRGAFLESGDGVVLRGSYSMFRISQAFMCGYFIWFGYFTVLAVVNLVQSATTQALGGFAFAVALFLAGLAGLAVARRLGRSDLPVIESTVRDALAAAPA